MSASRWLSLGLTGLIAAAGAPALADPDAIATLRGGPIAEEPAPPRLGDPRNDDRRLARNYPEQPPTIPHKVRDYQVDLNANRCLTCHSMHHEPDDAGRREGFVEKEETEDAELGIEVFLGSKRR